MDRVNHVNVVLELFLVGWLDLVDNKEGLIMVDMEVLGFFLPEIDVVDGCCFGWVDSFNSPIMFFVMAVQIEYNKILQILHSLVITKIV